MPLRVSRRTLERLDWPELLARWKECACTPRGRARLDPPGEDDPQAHLAPFATNIRDARRLQRETTEARRLLDRDEIPPFGGLADVDSALRRLARGGALEPRELLDLRGVLAGLRETTRWLARHHDSSPALSERAASMPDLHELEDDIDWCLDAEGDVRDRASPALSDARREAHGIAADLQRRLSAFLADPAVSGWLSDRFVTVRNDRFVLPVRSDARGRVRGIVHDASSSGTTLFVEPEAVVELNNRLKHAELTVQQETLRVLRDLSARATRELPQIEPGLEALTELDLAFARGRLSANGRAVEPEIEEGGVFRAPMLRHPLLDPARAVANDVRLGETFSVLVLSGPNAGGKTVTLKAVGLAALCARAGLHVTAEARTRIDFVESVLAAIGDDQSLRENLSTFSAHMASLARIVDAADAHALVLLDELGDGTDPGEGACLAQAILEAVADSGARVVATTHFALLKEMAAIDPRFANASFDFDAATDAPTYRMRMGVAGASSATAIAGRMGLRPDVLARAEALLSREDRRLEQMLADLAASRAALERERSEASRLRAESEATRDSYREKLERLQARRDTLFERMRGELDAAFRDAHAEVRAVIRDLQRGRTAQDASHAREHLLALERRADDAETLTPPPIDDERAPERADWTATRVGDAVRLPGGERGIVLALPDRQGRVSVQAGVARLLLASDRVLRDTGAAPVQASRGSGASRERRRSVFLAGDRSEGGSGSDLRGLRVEEAIARLDGALDRAAVEGLEHVSILHGIGSGALRDAVRAHLARSPYVAEFEAGSEAEGGDGVTRVRLRDA